MTDHFDHIAAIYDNVWQFTEEYQSWMQDNIESFLSFSKDDVFVDLGGGTGRISDYLCQKHNFSYQPYCVEPSIKMAKLASEINSIRVLNTDAITFSEMPLNYNKILLKEAVHHIKNRDTLWRNLNDKLCDGGSILIVTRPKDLKMPLFHKAKDAFSLNQPSADDLASELKEAKFDVEVISDSYKFDIELNVWKKMIRNRFMSDLSVFTDEEIETGIKEIEKTYLGNDIIEITDELIFILAKK